ncbi:MAG: DUF2029 domain-containing protein [Chloroflexi bacterium]|nr:DUF2029 domain-containing protein [Chloroflexota bacterium]
MSQRQTPLFAAILTILVVVNIIATHNTLTAPFPGHNDFMSRWAGARSFWLDGQNPYGEEASLNIQERIYGRAVREGEDPGYFAYPFYTVFVVWPLVYVDYAWASALWMVLLEACLIGALLLLLNLYHWRPSPLLLALLLVWSLLDYYAARGLILGQPGLLVYFLQILAVWCFAAQPDTRLNNAVAGLALAFSTLKPQMGYLLLPFLLLWGLRARRWSFLAAFTVAMAALMLLSFVLMPSWLGDWLRQLGNYSSYTALGSPVWIITQYYLSLGAVGEWAVNLLLYGLMLWAWYTVLVQNKRERWLWTVTLTLTITHLVAPRTATPHYVVFALPLLFYLRTLSQQRKVLWAALIVLALLIGTWIHALATVVDRFEHPTVYLPLPLTMLALLLLTRRLWWTRAPDIFSETVKARDAA